ncbi:hypothetical protein C8R45DRAFT_1221556 [Mycena sanguinolenta]|nr:hypothetical protein C8R45DRAFT_1221556 [Mycena sanguinolenta]
MTSLLPTLTSVKPCSLSTRTSKLPPREAPVSTTTKHAWTLNKALITLAVKKGFMQREAEPIRVPAPVRARKPYIIDISDSESEDDSDSLPDLVSVDSSFVSRSPSYSPALATDGGNSEFQDPPQPEFVTVPSQDIMHEFINLHHFAPLISLDPALRATCWARTQLKVDSLHRLHADDDAFDTELLIRKWRNIVQLITNELGETLDTVATKRGERVDLEDLRRAKEEEFQEYHSKLQGVPVLVDEHLLDTVSVREGINTRRVPTEPGILIATRGLARSVTDHAASSSTAYRVAVVTKVLQRYEIVPKLTVLRMLHLDYIKHGWDMLGTRRLSVDITGLHQIGYRPPPFLHNDEFSQLRLLQQTFARHQNPALATITDELLRFQYLEAEVISHFLINGLLDPTAGPSCQASPDLRKATPPPSNNLSEQLETGFQPSSTASRKERISPSKRQHAYCATDLPPGQGSWRYHGASAESSHSFGATCSICSFCAASGT